MRRERWARHAGRMLAVLFLLAGAPGCPRRMYTLCMPFGTDRLLGERAPDKTLSMPPQAAAIACMDIADELGFRLWQRSGGLFRGPVSATFELALSTPISTIPENPGCCLCPSSRERAPRRVPGIRLVPARSWRNANRRLYYFLPGPAEGGWEWGSRRLVLRLAPGDYDARTTAVWVGEWRYYEDWRPAFLEKLAAAEKEYHDGQP